MRAADRGLVKWRKRHRELLARLIVNRGGAAKLPFGGEAQRVDLRREVLAPRVLLARRDIGPRGRQLPLQLADLLQQLSYRLTRAWSPRLGAAPILDERGIVLGELEARAHIPFGDRIEAGRRRARECRQQRDQAERKTN